MDRGTRVRKREPVKAGKWEQGIKFREGGISWGKKGFSLVWATTS